MANYTDLFNCAKDAAIFHPKCHVAVWMVAQDIISSAGASAERKDWANRVMVGRLNLTGDQLAFQVLRNPACAQNLANSSDQQVLTAVLERLDDLVKIG